MEGDTGPKTIVVDESSASSVPPVQWSLFYLKNGDRGGVDNHSDNNDLGKVTAPTTPTPDNDRLEISNPLVPFPENHGLQLHPKFCSDDDIQSILTSLEQERSSWEGFQQRRRVYRYVLDNITTNGTSSSRINSHAVPQQPLPTSLRKIVDRFEAQFYKTHKYKPSHMVVEEYPPVNSMRINDSQKIFTTFESTPVCPVCCGIVANNRRDDTAAKTSNNSDQDSSCCGCFVAQVTLLPEAAIEHWNQPKRRDPQCYHLKSSQHWTDVRLPKGCLLIKTGECLWQWRTCLVQSGIPPSHAKLQPGPPIPHQPMQRIVILKMYRFFESSTANTNVNSNSNATNSVSHTIPNITASDGHDGPNRQSCLEQAKPAAHDSKVFGYVPSPQDLLPPDDAVMPEMSELLTIIITTSPIRSHPSTELLERTMSTFALAGPEFVRCRKVIVCDGFRLRDEHEQTTDDSKKAVMTKRHNNVKQALRNGIVTPTQKENYHQFIQNLKHRCEIAKEDSPFCHTQVVELDSRHGYGFALRHALLHCVSTQFVCVIQHDRTFMRPTPMYQALHCMWRHPNVKYVGMSMRSNLLYRDLFGSKYGPDAAVELGQMVLRPPELLVDANLFGPGSQSFQHLWTASTLSDQVRESNQTLVEAYQAHAQRWAEIDTKFLSTRSDLPVLQTNTMSTTEQQPHQHQMQLMPTLYWYDNTHLAETAHYRDFIFDPRYKMVARGGFVEDKLSPVLVKTVERLGLADGHARFGCFLLDDASGLFFTGHLDGGSYLTDQQRQAMQDQNLHNASRRNTPISGILRAER